MNRNEIMDRLEFKSKNENINHFENDSSYFMSIEKVDFLSFTRKKNPCAKEKAVPAHTYWHIW